ncbi:MAG: luciferase family oxidoreductase, group 1 [Phycisphaerales bacterium]|nr:luciferase family oxidoreductase, group 1 [Phycisphaerales bacterium]
MSYRLSILDQSPIAEGTAPGDALRNSIELAQQADRLGYHRYWLAEHHGSPALACNSPEVLIGPVAAATKSIRVGSGGIMLPHYSPLKVAESFGMLAGLFPDRIDLGIGRAAGTDRNTTFALQRDRLHHPPDDFTQQFDELLGYLAGHLPDNHPFARLAKATQSDAVPWLLGSSPQSAIWAGERGLGYVFADFINRSGAENAELYRAQFEPSAVRTTPYVGVAVWAVVADTDQGAEDLAASSRMMLDLLHRGRLIPVPSVAEAKAFLAEQPDGRFMMAQSRRIIAGNPETVKAGLDAVVAEYGADEVLVVNILHDHAARMRSYELLADAMRCAIGAS